jgi:hypothetical protein
MAERVEFHIKSDSLPRIIVKSFLFTLLVLVIVPSVFFMAKHNLSVSEVPAFYIQHSENLFRNLKAAKTMVPFAVFLVFMAFFSPHFRRYLHKTNRLWIDNRGISFDCRLQPRRSWHIAWQDIRPPIAYVYSFRKSRVDNLYIRSESDGVFSLDFVSAWQTAEETDRSADRITSIGKTDKRPAIVREIEHRLGQGAIKRVFNPQTLRFQARKTQRDKKMPFDISNIGLAIIYTILIIYMLTFMISY